MGCECKEETFGLCQHCSAAVAVARRPPCEHKRVLRIEGHWVPPPAEERRPLNDRPVPCDVFLTKLADDHNERHNLPTGTVAYMKWCRDCGCINLEDGRLPSNPEALYWRRSL